MKTKSWYVYIFVSANESAKVIHGSLMVIAGNVVNVIYWTTK